MVTVGPAVGRHVTRRVRGGVKSGSPGPQSSWMLEGRGRPGEQREQHTEGAELEEKAGSVEIWDIEKSRGERIVGGEQAAEWGRRGVRGETEEREKRQESGGEPDKETGR